MGREVWGGPSPSPSDHIVNLSNPIALPPPNKEITITRHIGELWSQTGQNLELSATLETQTLRSHCAIWHLQLVPAVSEGDHL